MFGLILNVPSDFKLLGLVPNPFNSKHWVAIKEVGRDFYNLDSKLDEPKLIGKVCLLLPWCLLLLPKVFVLSK